MAPIHCVSQLNIKRFIDTLSNSVAGNDCYRDTREWEKEEDGEAEREEEEEEEEKEESHEPLFLLLYPLS